MYPTAALVSRGWVRHATRGARQCSRRAVTTVSAARVPAAVGDGKAFRESATTIVVAPSPETDRLGADYRVLFVRRSLQSSFMPGAYVFPGGVIEPDDGAEEWQDLTGIQRADEGQGWMLDAARICAIRETLEEAGALLMGGHGQDLAPRLTEHRDKCNADANHFRQMVTRHLSAPAEGSGRLPMLDALGKLHAWSNFVTPVFEPKRFDAKFFLYTATSDKDVVFPSHSGGAQEDGGETIATAWLSPGEVLEKLDAGDLFLPPPQFYLMDELSAITSLADLERAAEARQGRVTPYQPYLASAKLPDGTPISVQGLKPGVDLVLTMPGDEEYQPAEKAGKAGDRHRILMTHETGRKYPRYKIEVNIDRP